MWTTSTRSRTHRDIFYVLIFCVTFALCVTACKQKSSKTTVRFWHFWSEPLQKKALMSIIAQFEQEHPDIDIEATELQWSEGQAKLQTAFAAAQSPDVVHLGLEWVHEFATHGALDTLSADLNAHLVPQLIPPISIGTNTYAMPWVMNTRALFLNRKFSAEVLSDTNNSARYCWSQLKDMIHRGNNQNPPRSFGVNSYEPHNVLKKVLPFLWSAGSKVFSHEPLSQSFDDEATRGLEFYCSLCTNGVLENSRSLDEKMRRDELSVWVSGMWNIGDSTVEKNYTVAPQFFQDETARTSETKGASILSADCYALSSQSQHKDEGRIFLDFLTRVQTQIEFCTMVPDAGFPAHIDNIDSGSATRQLLDSLVHRDDATFQFFRQTRHAYALPAPPYFLEAEQIMEQEIMQAVYQRKTAAQAMADARKRIQEVERVALVLVSP